MAASKVMTLRIAPGMLEELRQVARAEGRSVSAQVIYLVRRDLEMRGRATTVAARRRKPLPTYGWLRHLEAPETFEEFREFRRSLSKQVAKRLRKYPRIR
jgi:hypothetical protein